MKKILILLVLSLLTSMPVLAKNNSIKFAGEKYTLMYSKKCPETSGYLNEYYKRNQTYNNWTEMVGIHHIPNAYSPIDQIIDFRKYLNETGCPSSLIFEEKDNAAIIDFVIIEDRHLPVLLEFNVFRYVKNDKCGSQAIQYARRYIVKTEFEKEAAKRDIEKCRKKYIKKMRKFKYPLIISEDIDLGPNAYINKQVEKQNEQKTEEQPVADTVKSDDIEKINVDKADVDKAEVIEEEKALHEVSNKVEITEEKTDIKEDTLKEENKDEKQSADVTENSNSEKSVKKVEKDDNKEAADKTDKVSDKADKVSDKASTKNDTTDLSKDTAEEKADVNKQKHKKEKPYKLENDKEQYYAQTPDYKKIVKECKKQRKEAKKIKKINQKKAAKERAKKAKQKLEE